MTGNHYNLSKFVDLDVKNDLNDCDSLDGNLFQSDNSSVLLQFKDYENLKDLLRKGEKEMAKSCIEQGCCLNKDCTDYSCDGTPLDLAISLEYSDIVELLLEKGALVNSKNDNYETPLMLAAIVGNSQITDMILAKSKPINYSNYQDFSHFHIACMQNNIDFVQKFLVSGEDVNKPVKSASMFWPGFTPLHFAVEFRSIETAKLLIDKGAHITIQDSRGMTPLHLSFRKRNRFLTDLLLSKQYYYASNPVDVDGLSHFHIACALNKREIVRDFLDKRIDDTPSTDLQNWYRYCGFKFAIDNQCMDVLEYLLECQGSVLKSDKSRILNDAYNSRNENVLNLIISSIEKDMINIQCPLSDVNPSNKEKVQSTMKKFSVSQYTNLHLAVLQKNKDRVNSILDGIHPSVVTVTDAQGKTPLHLAFEANQKDLVDQLLPLHLELNENPKDSNNLSHFHISCTTKNLRIVEDFIKNGVDINMQIKMDSQMWAGCTPLHFAIMYGQVKVLKLLLDERADFTIKNALNISPYDLAIPHFYDEFIISHDHENHGIWYLLEQILLANEHQKFENFEDRGITLLHIASIKGDIGMINRYVSAETINKPTADVILAWAGFTPLHFATFSGHKRAATVLLNFGADPTIQNYEDCVAGHYLYTNDCIDDRLFLIPKIVYNDEGMSIFHMACRCGSLKGVQHFLKMGVDVNERIPHGYNNQIHTEEGKTPLHLAVEESSRPEIIKLLLEHGADVNARDCYFNTPLHFCSDKEILRILLDHGADAEALDCQYVGALEKPLSHYPKPELITAVIESGGDINKKELNFARLWEPTRRTILARHIERLTVLGFHVNEQNQKFYDDIITNDDEIRRASFDYKVECVSELSSMKEMGIDSRTTLYHILFKNSSQMAKYSKSETFRRIVEAGEDLKQKYPIYAYLVILQFKKGIKRANLLEEGKRSLALLMNRWMDELVFNMILEFMNDHEIMYLNYTSSGQSIFQ